MTTLRRQLFQEFAQLGLNETLIEFRRKFQVKKGDRFNYKGITYEIGPALMGAKGIEFEISSKIPQDELSESMTLDEYFQEVKRIMENQSKKPFAIDRENIIREIGADEVKERDYVKLKYLVEESELFDTQEIIEKASSMDAKAAQAVPHIPGVQTLVGIMVLLSIKNSMRAVSKETMEQLIEANERVRQEIRKKAKKT